MCSSEKIVQHHGCMSETEQADSNAGERKGKPRNDSNEQPEFNRISAPVKPDMGKGYLSKAHVDNLQWRRRGNEMVS